MGYAAQLRDLELISSNFVPTILGILNVIGGGARPFALDPWSVEEYYAQRKYLPYARTSLAPPKLTENAV